MNVLDRAGARLTLGGRTEKLRFSARAKMLRIFALEAG